MLAHMFPGNVKYRGPAFILLNLTICPAIFFMFVCHAHCYRHTLNIFSFLVLMKHSTVLFPCLYSMPYLWYYLKCSYGVHSKVVKIVKIPGFK